MDANARKNVVAPLDASLYRLEGKDLDFYRRETGIEDEELLREHILLVQSKAFDVSPCLGFLIVPVLTLTSLGSEGVPVHMHPDFRFLDVKELSYLK